MKEFKKEKKKAKFKKGLIHTMLMILPYLPMLMVFGVINIVLVTKYCDIVLKILSGVGLIFIAWHSWKLSCKLCKRADDYITKREAVALEYDLEVDE